jgi:hypothetical protein
MTRSPAALLLPATISSAVLALLALGLAMTGGHAQAQASGAFAGTPTFGAGTQAAAVFLGGSVDQLEAAARATGANGVWVQDGGGRFQLLVAGGPAFLRDAFTAQFPGGFATATAVTLTRPFGASSTPPPIATSTPTPRPTVPGGIPGPSTNE